MATHGGGGRLTFALVLVAAASAGAPVAGILGTAAPPTTLPPTTAPVTTAAAPTTAAAAATTAPATTAPTTAAPTTTLPPDRTAQRVPSPVPDVKIRAVSIPARRLATAVGVAIVALALAGFVYGRLVSRRRPLPPPTAVSPPAPSEPARPLPPPLPPAT